MKNDKVCLLITGCISPSAHVGRLSLKDTAERKKQYIDSIVFYLQDTRYKKIVYCDNSNAEPDESLFALAKKRNKDFEWISFSGDIAQTVARGKGYGEGEIIAYAINNSRIISSCECFIKITGRLKVKNIEWFLKLKCSYSYFDIHRNLIDTRCYLANKRQYSEQFILAYQKVNDTQGYYLEHTFFACYQKNTDCCNIIPFFLNIVGVSGSMGTEYVDIGYMVYALSAKKLLKSILRKEQRW